MVGASNLHYMNMAGRLNCQGQQVKSTNQHTDRCLTHTHIDQEHAQVGQKTHFTLLQKQNAFKY